MTNMIKIEPGSDDHLKMLMGAWHLNFLTDTDLEDVLAYARHVWQVSRNFANRTSPIEAEE